MDDFEVQTNTHLIHRGDFIDALVGVLPDGHGAGSATSWRPSRTTGDRSVLTFANGETVEADLVIGADGIKSTVRQQLFSDQQPVFAGEHAYRVVIDADAAHGMVVDDNLRMYIGRGTKVYLLPLRHRDQMSFDVTALNPDGTWTPQVTKDDLLADGGGLRRADREHRRATSTWTPSTSARSTTSTRSTPGTPTPSSSSATPPTRCCHHQGQGANSAIMDAGALADALARGGLGPGGAGRVPGRRASR